jgi:hypothetical protein
MVALEHREPFESGDAGGSVTAFSAATVHSGDPERDEGPDAVDCQLGLDKTLLF